MTYKNCTLWNRGIFIQPTFLIVNIVFYIWVLREWNALSHLQSARSIEKLIYTRTHCYQTFFQTMDVIMHLYLIQYHRCSSLKWSISIGMLFWNLSKNPDRTFWLAFNFYTIRQKNKSCGISTTAVTCKDVYVHIYNILHGYNKRTTDW